MKGLEVETGGPAPLWICSTAGAVVWGDDRICTKVANLPQDTGVGEEMVSWQGGRAEYRA